MELTFLMSFCRGAGLKALWSLPGVAQVVRDIKNMVLDSFGMDFYGTLLNDVEALSADKISGGALMDDKSCEDMSSETAQLLVERLNIDSPSMVYSTPRHNVSGSISVPPEIQQCRNLKVQGAVFAPGSKSKSDSLVHFRTSPLAGGQVHSAGEIQEIFVHRRLGRGSKSITEHFMIIRPFRAIPEEDWRKDPYRRYPELDVQLYFNSLDKPIVVKASDIVSHVATCPFKGANGTEYRIILSLDRVSRKPVISCCHPLTLYDRTRKTV